MGIDFLCSFPLPPRTFFSHFPCSIALRGVEQLKPEGEAAASRWTPRTYHSELVGRRAVLEQDVDDVGVPLLRSLVQRRVPILQAQGKGKAAVGTAHTPPPLNE